MKGSVQVHDLEAPSLAGNPLGDPTTRPTPIYLPPGYAGSRQRYPVTYFLHGFGSSGLSWLNVSSFTPHVPERLDRLVQAGAVPPMIGVFVDGWTAFGGSQWKNSEAIGRYGDYVVHDVVDWVDRRFRTLPERRSRALVGKSSGGFGALLLAGLHSDRFAHVGCHSGDAGFELSYPVGFPKAAAAFAKAGGVEPWYREFIRRADATKMRGDDHTCIDTIAMSAAYSPKPGAPLNLELPFSLDTLERDARVWNRWMENDPVHFVPKRLDAFRSLETVFIDCGTRDEFNLQWGARRVVRSLKEAGVDVVHEEFDDGHMGINYRYDRSLQVMGPKLKVA